MLRSTRVAAAGACALVLCACSPEELAYSPSGGAPDGSVGGVAGAGATGGASVGGAGVGGAGMGGSGVGGSGVGGTATWAEICGNGIDDDQDGKTDCQDPACESYACVAVAPSGWTGPVALYEGPAGTLADCPEGLSSVFQGHADLSFENASCGSCTCGAPTSKSCLVGLSYYSDSGCATLASVDSPATTCDSTTATLVGSVKITSFTSSGSCGPGSPATPTTSPPTWGRDARACALAAGTAKPEGCAQGEVCAPLTSAALACVLQSGDLDCPAGYGDRHVFHSGWSDSRGCDNCACAFSQGTCSTNVTFYSDKLCATPLFSKSSVGCYAGAALAAKASTNVNSTATCTPSGAKSSGCAVPDQPTTVCCAGSAPPGCPSGGGPKMVQVPVPGGGSYCIDSTEVTKGQYQAFLATNPSTANQPLFCSWNTSFVPQGWPPPASEVDEPVDRIDWCDANAFCTWAGKRLCGKIGGGATPQTALSDASQSQWFSACSAGGTRAYPYGDALIAGACPFGALSPVGSQVCCRGGYPGLYDLVGNAEEWEDSCEKTGGGQPSSKDDCAVRGDTACSGAHKRQRDDSASGLGFRCCS